MRSRSGTFVAVNRPPGAAPSWMKGRPELFGLTDATSNVASDTASCCVCAPSGGSWNRPAAASIPRMGLRTLVVRNRLRNPDEQCVSLLMVASNWFTSVFRRLFRTIDDEHFHRGVDRFQLEPKLILQCRED